jgi:hypothetical protein
LSFAFRERHSLTSADAITAANIKAEQADLQITATE